MILLQEFFTFALFSMLIIINAYVRAVENDVKTTEIQSDNNENEIAINLDNDSDINMALSVRGFVWPIVNESGRMSKQFSVQHENRKTRKENGGKMNAKRGENTQTKRKNATFAGVDEERISDAQKLDIADKNFASNYFQNVISSNDDDDNKNVSTNGRNKKFSSPIVATTHTLTSTPFMENASTAVDNTSEEGEFSSGTEVGLNIYFFFANKN